VATCRVRIRSLVCAATRRDSQKFTVKFRLCKRLARHRKSSNPRQFFRPTWRLGLKADDDHGGLLEACQSTPLLYVKNRAPKLQQRERGDSQGLRLPEKHDEIRGQWRELIERGWQQAQRGETVAGS